MTKQGKDFAEFYLTRPQPCPYLPDRQERKLFTHLGGDKTVPHFNQLHRDGFRRSQTIAYRPHCDGCSACVSVRIAVNEFKLTKSQKRVWKHNNQLVSQRHEPDSSAEQYELFTTYVENRHSDGGMADMSLFDYRAMIEDSLVDSFVVEYRQVENLAGVQAENLEDIVFSPVPPGNDETLSTPSTLKAVALCDRLDDGVSLVYSFFDPALSRSSVGTYIILETIEFARSIGLPYVYLGYWVKGSPKMDYKINFLPQDHFIDETWVRVPSPMASF